MPPFFYSPDKDLNYILKNVPVSFYNYKNRYIILYRDNAALGTRFNGAGNSLYSNIKYRLEGRVLAENDETPVIGATVYINELDTGTITNISGFYRFRLPAGDYTITVKSVGFVDQTQQVSLDDNKHVNINLYNEVRQLNEVVISGQAEANVNESTMGISKLNIKTIKDQPAFMGEVDVIRSLLMLPGVSSVGEASSGFNVRGGSADQNLVLLDGAPLFNSSHVFGLFSTFNQDLVGNVTLMRSGIPPEYGGRLSSVLNVKTKTDQVNRFSGEGGIGLFASRLTVQVPVIRDRLTVIAGGRGLYSDFLLGSLNNTVLKNSSAFFYDANVKVNFKIHKGSQLFYTFYESYDQFRLPSDTLYSWGTQNHSLIFNQLIGKNLVLNVTGVLAKYSYGISEDQPQIKYNWDAGIDYRSTKIDFYYQLNQSNHVDFGASIAWYKFNPGSLVVGPESIINPIQQDNQFGRESYAYLSDEFDLNSFIRVMAGLRYSLFSRIGPGTVSLYEQGAPRESSTLTGSKDYSKGQTISTDQGLEPRVSLRFLLNELNSIKLSYNRLYQYIQQISNTASITPIDLWYPTGPYLDPQRCDQLSVGYFRNFNLDKYEASAEIYYKWLDNVVDYKNGSQLFLNPNIETVLLQGTGKVYGLELSLKKNLGRVTGSLSYTYSRSFRKIIGDTPEETINEGKYFPSYYDIPHDFKITAVYKINRRWSMSGNFVFNTGRPATFPLSKYEIDKIVVANYTERNLQRIPDYHRLDFSVNLKGNNKKNKLWDSSWSFTVYNLYARKNAYSIYFKPVPGSRIPQAYKYTILGTIIPSIAYNFRFL